LPPAGDRPQVQDRGNEITVKNTNLLITGVGGQGIILASDIISETALTAGYDVKKTDTLGMAQRGGSVVSHVRIGSRVWSPLIKEGEVDILLAFEKLEAARWIQFLRPGAIVIINNHALPPLSVNLGNEPYPSDEQIANILKQRTDSIYFVDGTSRVKELGNTRMLNMFMLGCVSSLLPLKVNIWKESISRRLPPGIQQINITAFNQGRKEGKNVHI